MKFKKIEISAFRIYNNPENACFDFTTKSGNTADFVSLYAPNGFGKTSFYDAVEWGVTGTVNRFFIRNKEMSKLEKNQSAKNEIPLLRNSKLERDTYVKVFSNTKEEPFEKLISKESIDLDLPLKANIDSHEFQKVILSQEWISAFLTEKDGEERYRKFMENPELSEINNYYINLKHLLSVQQAEENQLNQDIKRLQKKVKDIEDENLLETINHQINHINSVYEQKELQSIDIETTNKELIEFKGVLAKKIIHYNNKQVSLVKKIDQLRVAKIGNEDLFGLKSFGERKQLLTKVLQEIKEVEQLIRKFEKHDELVNQLAKNKNILKESLVKRKDLEFVLLKFEQYDIVRDNIKTKGESQTKTEKEQEELNKAIEELKREEISVNEQLKSCIRQIEDNQERIKKIPSLQKSVEELDESINKLEKQNTEQINKKEELDHKLKEHRSLNLYYRTCINELEEAKYLTEAIKENPDLVQIANDLERSHEEISVEKEKLNTLNNKIKQQQILNSDIQEFLEQGLNIVNKRQSSNCPLCEQPYFDFYTLASKISSNKALNEVIQELFEQKQNINNTLNLLETKVKEDKQVLSNFYHLKIDKENIEIDKVSGESETIKKKIQVNVEQQATSKSKRSELMISIEGFSFIDYEKELKDQYAKYLVAKIKLTRDLNICKESLIDKSEANEKVKQQLLLLKDEIETLSKNANYNTVINYFKENYPSESISKLLLSNSIENLKEDQLLYSEDIKSLISFISSLSSKLSKYKKDNLKAQKLELENQKITLDKGLDKYALFLKENFEINVDVYDINEIEELIDSKSSGSKDELNKIRLAHDAYVALEKSSEHIVEFLQSEQTKITIKKKEEELSFLVSTVRKSFMDERESTKEFLKERIKDFFFEDLINKLYEKIDPHPDFKKVNFIPNLDVEPPRLDVFVKSDNSETLIPNLYFSSAQINILSLCIFLASALKSKDYDCIFIDDPIQSMDSINVLSAIDLLRSLVVNNGKQIIISTHDENFHKLLKKKMPREIFKSKFLKLESFGKVIEDEF